MTKNSTDRPLSLADFVPGDDAVMGFSRARRLLVHDGPVPHIQFKRVRTELSSAIKGSPLTVLMGVTGVGKTHLTQYMVNRLNERHGEPGRIPAVFMVAPTTQKSRFSWKAFWMRFLDELEEPLPGHKMDPEARARALRDAYPGSARRSSRLTESQYFEIACSAAKERGLVLLVIDEALALARSERGETLFDQIRVLRELADQEVFRIVLVSTVKIRRDLRRSGVLTRRLATVVFPRYRAGSGYTDEENYEYFVRAVVSFMKRLPESARAELTDAQCRMLYENCFGCVGLLCDWYARAIWKCVDSGQTKLSWVHFQSAALTVAERADIAFEAKEAADELVISGDLRLDVDEKHLCAVGQDRAQRDATNRRLARSGNVKRALRESGRADSRPGVPDPTHRQLA